MDRIAVLGGDGAVSTVRPDGTGARVVAPGGDGIAQLQATWSPDGRRLAWGRAERRRGEQARCSLVTADPDGADRVAASLPTMPFYLSWRPDGRALACLANGPQGIDLVIVAPGGPARVALRGAPLFISWAPAGDQLACHVDDERLVVVSGDPEGGAEPEEVGEGEGFSSPVWLDQGIVADVAGDAGRRLLAVVDPGTGRVARTLARHDGEARVVAAPGGGRLALCVGPLDPGRPPGIVMDDGEAIPEALTVLDLVSGSSDVVLASPPVAVEWSPDGRRLLVLVPDPARLGPRRLRWLVWDGGEARPVGPPFLPSAWWARTELAFAEQLAQSRRTWSPDSRSITYATATPEGRTVVVVHPIDGDPRELASGLASSWSPAEEGVPPRDPAGATRPA